MTKDTVEGRALKIAAQVMTNAGICRHESALKCRRIEVKSRSIRRSATNASGSGF